MGHTKLSKNLVDSLYYSLGTSYESIERLKHNELKGEKTPGMAFFTAKADKRLNGKYVISGKVVDSLNNPIPSAKVKISVGLRTNKKEVQTNDRGVFYFDKMVPGNVHIEVVANTVENELIGVLDTVLNTGIKNFELLDPIVALPVNYKGNTRNGQQTCYIDPLSIKAIKTAKFQHSWIATKEFEERLKVLHGSKKGTKGLAIYLDNLSNELWVADSLIALELGSDVFRAFSQQRLTTVELSGPHVEQLKDYYQAKRNEFQRDLDKRNAAYREKTEAELKALSKDIENMTPIEVSRSSTKVSRVLKTNNATQASYKVSWAGSGMDEY